MYNINIYSKQTNTKTQFITFKKIIEYKSLKNFIRKKVQSYNIK